jgi:hypothetical protein
MIMMKRGRESAIAASLKTYSLASADDYKGLDSVTNKSGILTLEEAENENGRVTSWKLLNSATEIFGVPSEVQLSIVRGGKPYVSILSFGDGKHAGSIVEVPAADWKTYNLEHAIRSRRD